MSVFTPAGSGGTTQAVTVAGASNPVVVNVTMPLAATEYSQVFPTNTRQFLVRLRGLATFQVAYVSGDSGLTYVTVGRGNFYAESDLTLNSPITLYFQSSSAGQVAEIVYWT